MAQNKFIHRHFGLFWGLIFFAGSVVAAVTFILPVIILLIEYYIAKSFSAYTDDSVAFDHASYVFDGIFYLVCLALFIFILVSRVVPLDRKKIFLIVFYFIHFIFASGYVCWHQQYLKYKDFVGGEGQDIFPLHIAIVQVSFLYPIIGFIFDRVLKSSVKELQVS